MRSSLPLLLRPLARLYRQLQQIKPYIALAFSPFARPNPQMLWDWKEDPAGKVCVFVHFDQRGVVHPYVLHQLRQIREAGFSILFVSNRLDRAEANLAGVRALCAAAMVRRNVGHDFGAWKDGIASLGDVGRFDALLMANDSVYGPIFPLAGVLQRMSFDAADVWGITDSWDIRYHLQSYFLLFSPAALRSPAFARFWKKLRYVRSKLWVIHKYEVGLSTAMLRAGLRCQAIAPYRTAAQHLLEQVRGGLLSREGLDPVRQQYLGRTADHVLKGRPLNATHHFWDYLITELGCPFIKRDLLQKNPVGVPFVQYWEYVIRQVSDYDTGLIEGHLKATARNRSV